MGDAVSSIVGGVASTFGLGSQSTPDINQAPAAGTNITQDSSAQEAGNEQRRRRAAAAGSQSTVLTSPMGTSGGSGGGGKTLLGQ